MCCASNCGLWIGESRHCLRCMCWQCFSLADRHFERESNRPQFCINDLHTSSAQMAAEGPPLVCVIPHFCSSHSAVVWARSICAPHKTPEYTLASVSLAPRCVALLAVVASSSMTILPTDSSPGTGLLMALVIWPCLWSWFTALHTGVPEEGFWSSYRNLLLQELASLAAKHCCLESKIVGTGVSPGSLIDPPG